MAPSAAEIYRGLGWAKPPQGVGIARPRNARPDPETFGQRFSTMLARPLVPARTKPIDTGCCETWAKTDPKGSGRSLV